MNCLICNSETIKTKYKLAYGEIHFCTNCNSEFLYPQPTDSRINEIYSKDYYSSWGVNSGLHEITRKMKYKTGVRHLKIIKEYSPKGTVLDIGCAFGFFLEAAKDHNYDVYGVEYSTFSAQKAKEIIGENKIFNGTLEEAPFPENSFDAITMFDLIEHTKNPIETIKKALTLLKAQGIILITTPNSKTLSNFLMNKKWIHYKEEHLFYFNPESINYLANTLNIEVKNIKSCKKVFNLNYVFKQFEIYHKPILSPLFNIIKRIIPKKLLKKHFSFSIGEMVVVLQKSS